MENKFREVAVESLRKIFVEKSYSNIVINNDCKLLDNKFHNLYRKVILGVIENVYFLDFAINTYSSVRTRKMNTDVLMILRLATYQFYFMDNTREDIVVNESVEYIKQRDDLKLSKFVNAVLRSTLRDRKIVYKRMEKLNVVDRLSITYSYPTWIINLWTKQFGKDNVEEVLKKNNDVAKLNIRVNTNKTTKDELRKLLEEKDIEVTECELADKGLVLDDVHNLDRLEEFRNGLFSVQSESSMLVGQVLNPKEGSTVLDVCAAPGGKTTDVAERLNHTGQVISRDLYEHKIRLINNDLRRLDLNNVKSSVCNASKLDDSLIEKVDYCIVDVPCSGLGIIRRKPEIKYNRTENDSENLFNLQYNILCNASKYLKVGGELVYSTCTTTKDENINVIKKFIKHNPNYELVDISKETKEKFDTAPDGYIEVYPHIHNMDGFFIAKIRRTMIQ